MACGPAFMRCRQAAAHRMLWVEVEFARSSTEVMGSMGHELWHTIEVIGEPPVTDNATMFFLYQPIGYQGTGQDAMETRAAIEASHAVRSEMREFDRR